MYVIMSYKGKFSPKNIKKYKGNPTNVFYRSLWERDFMKYCDRNPMILEWASEEIIIPYISSWDNKRHRYFPDFYIKIQLSDGSTKKQIIEIKPKKYLKKPNPKPKRKTRRWYGELKEWHKNQAKWAFAEEYCKNNGMEFQILTEDDLGY